jgi:hypothetical protein
MTYAAAHDGAFKGPIIPAKDSCFHARTSLESGDLTIVATVEIRGVPSPRVDRDHDDLLREFMQACDE